MVEFWEVRCERYWNGEPTYYKDNRIILLAQDLDQAKLRLKYSLKRLNNNNEGFEYRPLEEIHICQGGIMLAEGYDNRVIPYGIV